MNSENGLLRSSEVHMGYHFAEPGSKFVSKRAGDSGSRGSLGGLSLGHVLGLACSVIHA